MTKGVNWQQIFEGITRGLTAGITIQDPKQGGLIIP